MSRNTNFSEKNIKYWVAFSQFLKFGPTRFKKLLVYFQSLENAFYAPLSELERAGIDENTAMEFIKARQNINPDYEMEKLSREKIKVVTINSPSYPSLLKEIPDAPPVLYYRGNLTCAQHFCLGVVGSRKYSMYGQRAANKIVTELARAGLSIASGLALGIDTLAHEATLTANGQTIAVLGSGVNKSSVYPRANANFSEKILEKNGLLLSEFPLGTPALRHHFPQRNRIIAGLSLGILIIEAAVKSGALITSALALDYNRDIFCVPGSIFSTTSAGTNRLIRSGAQLITNAEEIIEALSLENITLTKQAQKTIPDTPLEKEILTWLNEEPTHINTLLHHTKLDTATINANLITMELKGYIKNIGGSNYVKNF